MEDGRIPAQERLHTQPGASLTVLVGWQPMETLPEKTEVLLLWEYEGADPIIRMGQLLYRPWAEDGYVIKLEIDYGDAGGWVFTDKKDSPTAWHALPEPPVKAITSAETGAVGIAEGDEP